jgi:pyruvate dehydrogenase E2 component (dihydrolipoamide acetyltransferase)
MFQFTLPDLGEGVHEGQVVSVLVNEGDPIQAYQPMLEVETDKAAVEIPSPRRGTVAKIHAQPGQVVKVGEVLVEIDDSGAAEDALTTSAAKSAAPPASAQPVAVAEAPVEKVVPAPVSPPAESPAPPAAKPAPAPAARGDGPVPAAPAVRKLARELGVDLAAVPGSGPRGRIIREDVERYSMSQRAASAPAAPAAPSAGGGAAADGAPIQIPGAALPDFSQYGPVRREPATQIRKTIAKQMTRAWLSVPRVTHCDTADITDLESNRKQFNAALGPGEPKLTMTTIVLKAVAASLRVFPMLNCSYDPDTGEIIYKDHIHLGVAVDTPRGLIVPVIRDVDRKKLPDISRDLHELADRARAVKFDISELRGATFTITNVGALGGSFVTPMVNFPEVGILALGRATMQPVVRDGQIVPRLVLPLSLSFDHRVVDGADGARFTRDVITSLENPLRLIGL